MKCFNKIIVILSSLTVLLSNVGCHEEKQDGMEDTENTIITQYKAAQIDTKSIYSLKYNIGSDEYIFNCNNGQWTWRDNKNLPLDNKYFSQMTLSLQSISTDKKISVNESELIKYGLSTPWLSITVCDDTYGTQTFCFGNPHSNNNYFFMSEADVYNIYLVNSSIAENFGKTPFDMVRNDTLPEICSENITGISFVSPGDVIMYSCHRSGKDGLSNEDSCWYVSHNSGDEIPLDSSLSRVVGSAYDSIKFGTPVGYTEAERTKYGLDKTTLMTVYYKSAENGRITDKNIEIVLGYSNSDGNIYTGLVDSVLSYCTDGSILTKLYKSINAGNI